MSLPSDFCAEIYPDPAPAEYHPHPLRSHSTEDLHDLTKQGSQVRETQSHQSSDRPDSCVLSSTPNQRRSIYGNRSIRDSLHTAPPLPTHPALRSASAERLSDAPVVGTATKDFKVIPSRPPLKPTISFGSETRMSYYSIDSFASSGLEQKLEKKSHVLAFEEEIEEVQRHQQRSGHGWRFQASFAVLCLLSFLIGMNSTLLATALPTIAQDLKIDAVQGFWTASSFLLASTCSQPLSMRLFSAFGSKWIYLSMLVVLVAGSITSGLAHDLSTLIVGRSLAGCGSGAVLVVSQLMLRQLADPQHLSKYEGIHSLLFWLGAATGPIVGGAATQTVGWQYAFWINVPFGFLALLCLPFTLRLPPVEGSIRARLSKVDYLGWLLLAGAVIATTLAISWAGTTYLWTSWHTLAPLLIGLVTLTGFMLYCRYRIDPILPVSIFRKATVIVSSFGTVVHGMLFMAVVYLMPLCIRATHKMRPLLAGLVLGPWTLALVTTGLGAGLLVAHYGHRWSTWAAWALASAGTGFMMLAKTTSPTALCICIGFVSGIALGMLLPGLIAAIQHSASTDDEVIHAGPLHTFFSTLGQTMGVSLGSCVFLNQLQKGMVSNAYLSGDATVYARDALALVNVIQNMTTDETSLRLNLTTAYIDALRWVWLLLCIVAGVAFVLSIWFLEDYLPVRKTKTDERDLQDWGLARRMP